MPAKFWPWSAKDKRLDDDNGDDDDIASIVADAALKVDGTSVTNSVTMLCISTLFCCKNDELLPPTARKEEGGANACVVHVSAAAIIESLAIVLVLADAEVNIRACMLLGCLKMELNVRWILTWTKIQDQDYKPPQLISEYKDLRNLQVNTSTELDNRDLYSGDYWNWM